MDCPDFGWGWQQPYFYWHIDWDNSTYIDYYSYAFRHPGKRANVLHMDGHVESVQAKVTSSAASANYKDLWSNLPTQ